MRTLVLVSWCLVVGAVVLAAQPGQGGQAGRKNTVPIFIGTYTDGDSKGIYRLELDPAAATLSEPRLVAEAANPSFLAWHPTRPLLFAVSETSNIGPEKSGAIVAFAVAADGALTKINEQPTGGGSPCYVSVDASGSFVLVANYGGGSLAVFPVRGDGGLEAASSTVRHSGSSQHPTRQRRPHAHAILPAPKSNFVLAADLGIDRVAVYKLANGVLTANDPNGVATAPGAGPRHLAFHPGGDAVFVINELGSTVMAYGWDTTRGVLTPRGEAVSTLPADFKGENTTAEVVVHPNGRFVYGSNRGHDSIAVFSLDAQRALRREAITPTGGKTPRNFSLDPAGQFLLAANQDSSSLSLFRVDGKTGQLTDTGVRARVPNPVCVRFQR